MSATLNNRTTMKKYLLCFFFSITAALGCVASNDDNKRSLVLNDFTDKIDSLSFEEAKQLILVTNKQMASLSKIMGSILQGLFKLVVFTTLNN
ncbi:hypothetical protein [Dysgonomonas sp. ZJ709]|uniref:hypothetical protein n=1 Tax=Dysgonomonas sp. ZJ709 TaxID=2709797 RepID=UPI0013ED8FA6|nr:hypothetical protein [Dysgonomonas sp. ZJ709]